MTKKIISYAISILSLIILLCASLLWYFYLSTKNPETGKLQLKGISGPVTINKDQYGIPHIEAMKDDHDAFFALGYVHAQDRFWQMEFQRRVAKGTLSEIFGEDALLQDQYLRTWGFYHAAQASWSALDSVTQSFVHSYTQGVNAFLARGNLSIEFKILRYQPEPWTDVDSIAWQKMMAWNLQRSWEDKLINYTILKKYGERHIPIFQPPYPHSAPTVLTQEELRQEFLQHKYVAKSSQHENQIETINDTLQTAKAIRKKLGFEDIPGKGSNSWVVSGKLTQTGKPILANDPHLQFSAPVIWYLAELKGPSLHVVGATVPGLPFVIIGHNDYIGWGVTDAMIDAQDLYVENEDAKLTTQVEQIKIKNKADFLLTTQSSIHGPLINTVSSAAIAGQGVALKWPALLPGDTTIKSFYLLNYARNWRKFNEALQWHVAPALNVLYADRVGNIGYTLAGKVPKRTAPNALPISSTEHNEWNDYIPTEQLPHVLNPNKGYLVSANNKIVPDAYPYPLTFRWAANPYRASRIIDLIAENTPLTVATTEKMQTDTKSYLWLDLRSLLLSTQPLDAMSEFALKELTDWNGVITTQEITPTLFAYWYKELKKLMPKEIAAQLEWPEAQFIKEQLQTHGVYCQTATTKNCHEFLSVSLQNAIAELIKQNGKDKINWQWGKIHRALFKANGFGDVKSIAWIWNRGIATASGDDTVNVGSYDIHTFAHTEGAAYRQILDFSQLDNSQFITALGQSGNVFSAHYADQLPLWNNSQYISMTSDLRQSKKLVFEPIK